ncbi:Eco57I restriction-modification methylase domain-containing protein [Actinokineospora bangkokensis]|uniref:site-specific DNA-methyltransferase (adenine-specific) n=1 Tax=Actinokineospora bangkokensis TaxID=1193682 RepID=A0A1Q9LD43_9PSEU|nr:DNA methyltransferase [Actinokineospora bangkokensis]OLR89929.1 type II restriction endonuclease subunit M [Actinokineospora bangkokensis]
MTRPGRKSPPNEAELHRRWLELVDTDGPFLAVPALKRVWPQGMPRPDADAVAALKDAKPAFEKAWEDWDFRRDDPGSLELYRKERDIWVETVLRDVFGWGESYRADSTAEVRSPDHSVTMRASGEVVHREAVGALVLVVDPVESLRDPLDDGWAASPIDRVEELLRSSGVPIGVVTDGRWWAIVSARRETMAASGIVDAQTWIEEAQTRDAVIALLQRRRLIGGKPEDRLTELFGESVAAAEEITEALGTQVRRAVELLVQALSEAALGAEDDPLPEDRGEVYEAAVTVMMRVVFLLFAEERGLLPQGRLFNLGYGISEELDALDTRVREESAEALDNTYLTWHRLLATSLALYQGASFEDIRLPSYGGSLFDSGRFPFLTAWGRSGGLAITVSDRVMLEVLRAVQVAKIKGQPARRISFRDIDVEQIGYIYEGLLGYSCAEVDEVMVGLIGKEGEEPEVPLAVLESFAESKRTDTALAEALLAWAKENQPAATPPSKAALTKAIRESSQVEDAERALRAVTTDEELRHRLRPFVGIIRRDLRNRPLVAVPGGVLVVETPSRASAGAHYTPKSLAEEVVLHALEPLVYDPGPHQTANRDAWAPVSSDRILDLKIADIACGSGAFLVAAARYLAARLVEAWRREGVAIGTPHDQQTHAVRTVVANCLYGADINGMAVEMCKLSLWLVSLDARLPFSFVDDKILHGNSLLGITDVRQLKFQHIDPDSVRQMPLFQPDLDGILSRAVRLREKLASEVDNADPQRSATTKRRQWGEYRELVARLNEIGDAVTAAGLRPGGKPSKKLNAEYENLRIALSDAYAPDGDRAMLDGILTAGLTPTVRTDYERWKPLHWPVMVPDVMTRGGFDAVIGNPPFLGGQKLTGTMGTNVRDWFVNAVAGGTKGSADLVGYFFLRASALLNAHGNLGLIATNTVAQGDTREVGLDRMVAGGFTITRAIQSRSWPVASANLEYAAVWGTREAVAGEVPRVADGVAVAGISTLLEPAGRVDGAPVRLAENTGMAFIGCYVLGMGFVLEPEEAADWIEADAKNAEVLFPYLNGEDLNSRPDTSPSRRVIDFNNLTESAAKQYAAPFQRVYGRVRPERLKNKRSARRDRWWQFAELALGMRKAVAGLTDVLVIARVSKTVMPVRVSGKLVASEATVIFATESFADQAVLSSSMHQTWAIKYGSGMRNDPRYTPSDVFETFPRPEPTERLAEVGRVLDGERREIMLRRQLGLTKLYNLVNDPGTADSDDADVARMREIHVELDRAVMAAYGWDDVPLDHGFHTYRQMTRWTVSPAARVEILDLLLEENHKRAAAQGEAPPPIQEEEGGE